jgi:hypothetical protein
MEIVITINGNWIYSVCGYYSLSYLEKKNIAKLKISGKNENFLERKVFWKIYKIFLNFNFEEQKLNHRKKGGKKK